LLVAVAAGAAFLVLQPVDSRALDVVLVVVAGVAGYRAVYDPRVTVRHAVAAIGVLVALAVVQPPVASHDVWSYLSYGRMVSVHHASPYTHVPADFPHDPFFHLVGHTWRHTPSMYGPAFAAVAGAAAWFSGSSVLVGRLCFQLLSAGALGAILLLVWRRTRHPGALLAVGLNPVLVLFTVHEGHNDVLLGLAILGAVLLAERERQRVVRRHDGVLRAAVAPHPVDGDGRERAPRESRIPVAARALRARGRPTAAGVDRSAARGAALGGHDLRHRRGRRARRVGALPPASS
jgi:hypothetical protein